uniref:Probable inosine/xanthosine triphosphatase n=1 Tax=Candidatus Methanophaga sp. ANME-1 ERB7 TaxID=2759913 RepID=A0A7G9Z9N5_9EURY|nr:inosine/xanthosine triphosphatase [Methanosarcinales archaeon ANME-1 ERB7]
MKVLVGSRNPVKVAATAEAFSKYFDTVDVLGIRVNSNVPNQPVDTETFVGARNRAFELTMINEARNFGAEFFVGIEGGIKKLYDRWFTFGVMCIMDNTERVGYGTSPFFELPTQITKALLNGVELGDVMDSLIGERNTKERQGAVGHFTNGVMDRKAYYVAGLVVALIPFLNPDLYFESIKNHEISQP